MLVLLLYSQGEYGRLSRSACWLKLNGKIALSVMFPWAQCTYIPTVQHSMSYLVRTLLLYVVSSGHQIVVGELEFFPDPVRCDRATTAVYRHGLNVGTTCK